MGPWFLSSHGANVSGLAGGQRSALTIRIPDARIGGKTDSGWFDAVFGVLILTRDALI
jgi:hypothetical protein